MQAIRRRVIHTPGVGGWVGGWRHVREIFPKSADHIHTWYVSCTQQHWSLWQFVFDRSIPKESHRVRVVVEHAWHALEQRENGVPRILKTEILAVQSPRHRANHTESAESIFNHYFHTAQPTISENQSTGMEKWENTFFGFYSKSSLQLGLLRDTQSSADRGAFGLSFETE